MLEKTYKINRSNVIIRIGDITQATTQVIVSSDDYYLSMGGGVSASILRAGGNEIALDAAKKVPANLGDVIITTAGRLKSKFIFHTITIGKGTLSIQSKEVVRSAISKCLDLMNTLNLSSISFPALGSGMAGFDYKEVASEMADVISRHLTKSSAETEIIIYLFDQGEKVHSKDYLNFFEIFASKAMQASEVVPTQLKTVNNKPIKIDVADAEAEIKRKRLHSLRVLLGMLEDQRFKLEEKLIDYLASDDTEASEKTIGKLRVNEELRLGRLQELKELSQDSSKKPLPVKKTPIVFLSSTYTDLVEHRKLMINEIRKRKMIFVGMEDWGAIDYVPAEIIVEEVNNSDIYVGVFGVRYGSIDPVTGISMTELEFLQAKVANKKMLLYLIKDTANVKVNDIEKHEAAREKLERLKTAIKATKTVYFFDTPEDLAKQFYADLEKI